jgi:hypothetical protein
MSSDGDCAILPDDEAWVMLEVERMEAVARLKSINGVKILDETVFVGQDIFLR